MSYTTHYVFQLDIEAEQAIAKAKEIGATLGSAIDQGLASTKELNRLENQIARLKTVVNKLVKDSTSEAAAGAANIGAAIEQEITSALAVVQGMGFTMGSGWYEAGYQMGSQMGSGISESIVGYLTDMAPQITKVMGLLTAGTPQLLLTSGGGIFDSQVLEDTKGGIEDITASVTELTSSQKIANLASAAFGTVWSSITGSGIVYGKDGLWSMRDATDDVTKSVNTASASQKAWSSVVSKFRTAWAPLPGLIDAFTQGVTNSTKQVWALRRAMYGLETLGRSIKQTGLQMASAIQTATESYASFNEAITRAALAMEMSIDMEGEFEDATLSLASDIGAFDAEEIAEGLRLWAAGTGVVVDSYTDLNKVLEASVAIQKLAALNAVNLESTIDQVGSVIATFGLRTEDTTAIVAALNYVAAKSFANVDDLGSALKMVGPIVDSLGVSFNEVVVALGQLSDANIKGTMAGRALRQTFIKLSETTDDANRVLNQLTQTANNSSEAWKDVIFPEGEFIGFAELIKLYADGMEDMTTAQRNAAIASLTTANEQSALTALINRQIEGNKYGISVLSAEQKLLEGVSDAETEAYIKMQEALGENVSSTTSSLTLWEQMWERFESSMQNRINKMQNRWQEFVVSMGDILADIFIPTLENALGLLEQLQSLIEENPILVKAFAGTAVVTIAGGSLLEQVGDIGKNVANLTTIVAGFKAAMAYLGSLGAGGTAAAAGSAAVSSLAISAGSIASIAATTLSALMGGTAGALFALLLSRIRKSVNAEALTTNEELIASQPIDVQELFNEMFRKELFGGTGYILRNNEYEQEALSVLRELYGTSYSGFGATKLSAEDLASALSILADRSADASSSLSRLAGTSTTTTTPSETSYYDMTESEISLAEIGFDLQDAIEAADKQLVDDVTAAGEDYRDTQNEIRDSLIEDVQAAQADAAEEQIKAQESLYEELEDLQKDYLSDSEDNEASYQKSILESTQDFQLELERMERDHRYNMIDLLESRDVQAISKEMRDYQVNRADTIQDFNVSMSRTAEDFAQQQQELTDSYEERVAAAQTSYAEEAADRKEALAEEISDLRAQADERQKENAKAYASSLRQAQDYHDEIVEQAKTAAFEAGAEITGLAELLRAETYPGMLEDMNAFMDEWTLALVTGMGDSATDALTAFADVWGAVDDALSEALTSQGMLESITITPQIEPSGVYGNTNGIGDLFSSVTPPDYTGVSRVSNSSKKETNITIVDQSTYSNMNSGDISALESMVDKKLNTWSSKVAQAVRA